jgi:hypothetical protein
MEPSELFLASAVTGVAVLIEIGAFILSWNHLTQRFIMTQRRL